MGFLAGRWTNRRQRILEQQESGEKPSKAPVGKGFSQDRTHSEHSVTGKDHGDGGDVDGGAGGGASMVPVVRRLGAAGR